MHQTEKRPSEKSEKYSLKIHWTKKPIHQQAQGFHTAAQQSKTLCISLTNAAQNMLASLPTNLSCSVISSATPFSSPPYPFCSPSVCYQQLHGHCASWWDVSRAFLSALGATWCPTGAYFASLCFYWATMQQTKRSNINQLKRQTTCSHSNTENVCTAQLSDKGGWLQDTTEENLKEYCVRLISCPQSPDLLENSVSSLPRMFTMIHIHSCL